MHAMGELPDLLPTVDAVVVIVPLTPSTAGLVDAQFLAALPDGALLVNMARGKVVDTDALLAELGSGRLRAALDVTDPEPLPADHPLWDAPNLVITPHVGGFTDATDPRFAALLRRQLTELAAGREPINVVRAPASLGGRLAGVGRRCDSGAMTLTGTAATDAVDPRHWRVVLGRLHTTVETGSFVRGLALVTRVTEVAERLGHHPDVDLRYPVVHLSVVSHDVGGLTERDVALAREISRVLDELGLEAAPRQPQALEVAIDALDIAAVVPFWRAVLGYADEPPATADASPALVDPAGIGPSVWFQQMDAPRPQRNRIHLDVSVPHDEAEARVAAGGGGRRTAGQRHPGPGVLGAGRPGGQRGLRVHLAGARLSGEPGAGASGQPSTTTAR